MKERRGSRDERSVERAERARDEASGAVTKRSEQIMPMQKSKNVDKRKSHGKLPRQIAAKPDKGRSASAFVEVSVKAANEMMRLLQERYPDATCELEFANDFQLLIAVILSAQCTDVQVNKVTKVLFRHFPDARTLAAANLDKVKEIVRPTGYYNAKATNIQNCARAILERYGGKVPTSVEKLTSLPGVGRKTANAVLGVAHSIPGWTVDTHVQRLSRRLGLSANTDPLKIEQDLQRLFPKDDWSKLSITLIWHGRRTCFARGPDCEHCPINHLCPSSLV